MRVVISESIGSLLGLSSSNRSVDSRIMDLCRERDELRSECNFLKMRLTEVSAESGRYRTWHDRSNQRVLALAVASDQIFSGRRFTTADFDTIRQLISDHPSATRAKLSHLVCQALDWRKPDGCLKSMRCRVVMLRMHEQGLITIPPPRKTVWRQPGEASLRYLDADTEPQAPVTVPVHHLGPLQIDLITAADTIVSRRCNTFIFRYHYLGFQRTPGAQLRYRVLAADGRELAYLIWGSAAWKTAPRDRWIGWTAEQRQARLHHRTLTS